MFTEFRRRRYGICGQQCRGHWCGLWRGHSGNHVGGGLTWVVAAVQPFSHYPDLKDQIDRTYSQSSAGEQRLIDLLVVNTLNAACEEAKKAATVEERKQILADYLWKQIEKSGTGYNFGDARNIFLKQKVKETLARIAERYDVSQPVKEIETDESVHLTPKQKMYLSAMAMTMWAAACMFVTYWCVVR